MQDHVLRTLITLGNSVLEESELELVFDRVIAAGRELTGARYAALGVLDDRRERLGRFLTSGIDEHTREMLGAPPSGHGVLGELIRDPRPLRLPDVGAHPRSYGFPVGHPRMETFLGVPILVGGQAWGNLYLCDKEAGGEFTEDDEQAVVMLARYAGIAIDNARRIEDLSTRRDELEGTLAAMRATTEISRALAGETDLNIVLELIAKRGRALVGASALLIELVTGDRIRVAAAAGDVDRAIVGRDFDVAPTVAGRVLETRRPQRLSDELNRSRFESSGVGHFGLDAGAGLFVPLLFRTETPGVLVALNRPGAGDFSEEDEHLLTSFATSAASAVVTARSVSSERMLAREAAMEEERRRWARELHDETLQGLGALRLAVSAARRATDPDVWQTALADAITELDTEIANVRGIISDVRPAALDELGLGAAVEALADKIRSRGIDVHLKVDLAWEAGRAATRHEDDLETALYRIAQEAMTNGLKHSGAEALTVGLSEADGLVTVCVQDDGQGFDPSEAPDGFGLVGMRERVELLGGSLVIDATPGGGTTVRACLPVRRRPSTNGTDLAHASTTADPRRSASSRRT
jgi:signal transduction histidine kinase